LTMDSNIAAMELSSQLRLLTQPVWGRRKDIHRRSQPRLILMEPSPQEEASANTSQLRLGKKSSIANYFATVTPQPYQGSKASQAYPPYIIYTFNQSSRGYPDVAAWSSYVEIVLGGEVTGVCGTSVSSPVFAGMVSLINARRIEAGQAPMGFLNPFLYQYGPCFSTDITSGSNNCGAGGFNTNILTDCCKQGFYSTTGWDPLTGLGTPIFESMLTFALTLPGVCIPSSATPSLRPTRRPTQPTQMPSAKPVVSKPTFPPVPTAKPTTKKPTTKKPTTTPSKKPTAKPSKKPTAKPSTNTATAANGHTSGFLASSVRDLLSSTTDVLGAPDRMGKWALPASDSALVCAVVFLLGLLGFLIRRAFVSSKAQKY